MFGLSFFLVANFGSVSALTIEGNFIGGEQLGPSIGGGNIVDIFRAAADMWELAIRDDFVVKFDYGWGPDPGGYHYLLEQGGTPNRETRGQILVNPQVYADGSFVTLFLDPTPRQSEEFPTFSQRTQDLGGGPINVERRFSTPFGDQSPLFQDLLTIFLHEIGHGLGFSNANISFIAEGQDGKIDVTAPLPFACTTIPLAFNNFGVTSHIDLYGPVMGSWGFNERVLPSSLDILAVAQLSGFRDLNLDLHPPDEFPIATTTGREIAISAAFDGTNYLVGIEGDAVHHSNITAQLVSQSGTLVGSKISVGRTGGAPFVAFDGTNYLMVWPDDATGPNDHIYGQLVSKSGHSVGWPFPINQSTGRQELYGFNFLIFDGTNYFVVWESRSNPDIGDTADIYGQFVTPSGTLLGSAIPVSTAMHGQRMPALAFDGTNILVVWADGRNQSACYTDSQVTHCYESDIYGQLITKSSSSSAGTLLGTNFVISTSTLPRDNPPAIAFDGTNYLITFAEETTLPNTCPTTGCKWDIYGQLVTKAGAPTGSKITINNTSPNHSWPLPVFNGTNYLVTWTEGFGSTEATVKGRFFDKSGGPVGSEFALFSPSGGRVPWVAGTIFDGSKYFSVINRGTPGIDPYDEDAYTNQDVFGAFNKITIGSNITGDFDGDGATDVAAFHLPTDQFFTDYAGNLGQFGWGGSDSMPLIWDYDGDGKTDVSIYHIPTNQWFVKGVGNLGQYGWGGADSIPVPGDYNGDGRMERAFYHSPTNRWFVEGQEPVQFGWNGAECIPVPGDYDGDGKTDMVIYHIPSNQWFQYGVGNLGQFGWGGEDCIPVPGDYNGDGKMEIAVYHIPTNQWFVKGIGNLGQYGWGGLESFPIPGDYNGDGVMERGFYRASENRWFIEGESDFVWGWGGSEFMPITSQIAVYNWFRFMLHKFE